MPVMPYVLRSVDARNLAAQLTAAGVKPPKTLARAVEICDLIDAAKEPARKNVLALKNAEVLGYISDRAVHAAAALSIGQYAHEEARNAIREEAAADAAEALRNGEIDETIKALRPRFDKAAAVLTAASGYGISHQSDAQFVLELDNPAATALWREVSVAMDVVASIANIRIELSKKLNASPTLQESLTMRGLGHFDPHVMFDYTVAFAAQDNWSVDGTFHLDQAPGKPIDWFRMAVGGLRLNTPEEVRAKQDGREAPPTRSILDALPERDEDDGSRLDRFTGRYIQRY